MSILGHPKAALAVAGGIATAREIAQQPAVWRKIEETMAHKAAGLRAFLEPLLERRTLRIVLTGAGTSAFVGLGPPCPHQASLPLRLVVTSRLVEGHDQGLRLNRAIVPRRSDAGRQDA